jgi:hypothetical protein
MKRTSLVTTTTSLTALTAATAGGLVLALTAAGTAAPARQVTHHQLSFTAHSLASRQVGSDHLIESDKAVKSGHVIGYTANSCTFDFSAGTAHCWVTFARPRGELRSKVVVNAATGQSTGRITGGTGIYHGATGTVTGQEGNNPDTVKITRRWTD